LPKSGLFPYLSITNSPNAVKFTVDNSSQLVTKNISIASSLIEPFHWLERISFNFNIGLIVKNLLSPYKKFLSMNGDKPLCSDRVDIIIIIEYFSKNTADIGIFNSIEEGNPGYNIEYWITEPSIKNELEAFERSNPGATIKKILSNEYTILNTCRRQKSIGHLSADSYRDNEVFKKSGYILSKIWWKGVTSYFNSVSYGIEQLLKNRTPKILILTDDTKPYGSIAAKIARNLNIPSVLIPHAIPSPFYLPLACDYQTSWGKGWSNLLVNNKLSNNRILTVGDLSDRPNMGLLSEKNSIKKKLNILNKRVIGYFSSPEEVNDIGVLTVVEVASQFEDIVVIVRSHPRHAKHSRQLKAKLKYTKAIYIPFDNLDFDEFCCACDIVATFESTSILRAIRYKIPGFQVVMDVLRAPENDYRNMINLNVAHNKNEILEILKGMGQVRRSNCTNDIYREFGRDAAVLLFSKIKNIIKVRNND